MPVSRHFQPSVERRATACGAPFFARIYLGWVIARCSTDLTVCSSAELRSFIRAVVIGVLGLPLEADGDILASVPRFRGAGVEGMSGGCVDARSGLPDEPLADTESIAT